MVCSCSSARQGELSEPWLLELFWCCHGYPSPAHPTNLIVAHREISQRRVTRFRYLSSTHL